MAGPPFAAVYFDCDSTLCGVEGVDELLRFAAPELAVDVRRLTTEAMEGRRPLADVYQTRLALLAPSRQQLEAIGAVYVQHALPDAAAVVGALQQLGKRVGIVSGGLQLPVLALAARLAIDAADVHAVAVRFAADGSYLDFDRSSPLWQNGGKVAVLRALPSSHRPLCFVGDGVTDLETQGTADRFIGFGGVAVRAAVQARAECWCPGPGLAGVLPLLLTTAECQRLRRHPDYGALLATADN